METLDRRLQKRMHVSLYALLFLTCLLGLSVLLEGCTDTCDTKVEYTVMTPLYTSFEEIRASTGMTSSRPISSVGKIYIKDELLFINDPGKGIHIIDNSDPAHPKAKSFLNIPGNYDLAVKGNTLYADSYVDLVAFNIQNVDQIAEVSRQRGVFSYFSSDFGFIAEAERGIITGWADTQHIDVTHGKCGAVSSVQPMFCYDNGVAVKSSASFFESLAIAPGTGSGPGVGGSMARFTVSKNHLYALNNGAIVPFDLSVETAPEVKPSTMVSWDIETIFPYKNHLFLGSRSGMHIMNISSPESPVMVSTYEHIRSCDPVVVDDQYAYVTLRSGTECQGFTNQLEVINIEDLSKPQLLKVYPMTNPHGLGLDENMLFLCDGSDGLKIFDAADVNTIDQNLLAHYSGINTYDVIPFNNVLIMNATNGLYQYDYSDPNDIKLLSYIPANEN